MTGTRRRLATEAALRRRTHHMDSERAEAMEESFDEAENWRGTCQICGETIVGTREFVLAHAEEHRGS